MCVWGKQVSGIMSLFDWWATLGHPPQVTWSSRCDLGNLCFELCLVGMRGQFCLGVGPVDAYPKDKALWSQSLGHMTKPGLPR